MTPLFALAGTKHLTAWALLALGYGCRAFVRAVRRDDEKHGRVR